ncbi:hypothetical protein SAMN05216490_2216 [Mucilaginibacter mallensis]|uniref:Uncharacterized protein n=1 Tax=Mucilaginibacter mallensis TaxID=652787 RepID=A0A1H1WKH7_MUCMA|nr:hypothetical protein [Mucilaginibacter mallensis]SDS97653.1 hypothetical protein SAMN05216490_2216 [Mucilaginibacter mallensis]
MQEDNKNIDFFNSAIIISIVTADIYLSAYEFESGYSGFFNIPNYLIEISITNILSFAGSAILLFTVFMNVSGVLMPMVRRVRDMENGYLKGALMSNIAIIIITLLIIYMFPLSNSLWYTLIGVFLSSNLLAWLLGTLLSIKDKKPILAGAEILHHNNQKFSTWYLLFDKMDRKYILPFGFMLVLPFFMYLFGQGTAMKQTKFECVTGHNNMLVIRKYGDLLICNSVDTIHKTPTKQLVILKISDKNAIALSEISIGPLRDSK